MKHNYKIVAFTGETFGLYSNKYFTSPTSISFLQKTFGDENVKVVSSSRGLIDKPLGCSSEVCSKLFYPMKCYSSTKDFMIKSFTTKGFLRGYIKEIDVIIKENTGSIFWVRTPSMGSVIFGLRVIRNNEKLINHICANFSNTWKNDKYSILEKAFGFLVSKYLTHQIGKICSNKNVINLTTGDELEVFSKKYSDKTYQFVDLMTENKDDIGTYNKSEKFNISFVGRVVKDKGIFDLIEAMRHLPENVILNIAGGGDDLKEVKNVVKKNNLQNRIIIHGQLSFNTLDSIYRKTDLTIIPSNNYYEGFPRVIMESWSYSIPVVVTNVGGINAFVKNHHNGIIIKPGDQEELIKAIMKIYSNSEFRYKINMGAKEAKAISNIEYWQKLLYKVVDSHVA